MNQRKPNRIMWYSLALVLVLCIGFAVMSTGTAFARYRSELQENVTFEVQEPEQISLGTLEGEAFTANAPNWETVESENQTIKKMDLAVANGTSDTDFARQDQAVSIRVLGSTGLWNGESAATITLIQEDETTTQATATPIAEGTELYHYFGAGWIFTFQDTEGEELSWTLPGGELNFVSMTVTIENAVMATDALIQIQAIGKVIGE